ncbi:MAG: hypothetical protein ACI3U8_05560 [Candidatus Onthomonas sp.]
MPQDTTYCTLHTPAATEDLIDPREQKIRRLTAQVAELEQTNQKLTERLGEIQRLAAGALTETAELPETPERPAELVDGKEKRPPENRIRAFLWDRRQKREPAADRVSAVTVERTGWRKDLNLPVALTIPAMLILVNLFAICGRDLFGRSTLEEIAEYITLGLLWGLLAYVCIKHSQATRAAGAVGVLLYGALLVVLGRWWISPEVIVLFYLFMWLGSGLIRWKFGDGVKPTVAAAALCGAIVPVIEAIGYGCLSVRVLASSVIYVISYALCFFGLTRIRPKGESKKDFWILFGVVAACGLGIYILS